MKPDAGQPGGYALAPISIASRPCDATGAPPGDEF